MTSDSGIPFVYRVTTSVFFSPFILFTDYLDAAGIEPDALLAGWESNPTFLTAMFRLYQQHSLILSDSKAVDKNNCTHFEELNKVYPVLVKRLIW